MSRRTTKVRSHDWLTVLEVEGPFLAAPVVKDAFPAGLPALERDAVRTLRERSVALDASLGSCDGFVQHVLADLLDWAGEFAQRPSLPQGLDVPVPEHRTHVPIDLVLRGRDGSSLRLLGQVLPPGAHATGKSAADSWAATPADRLAHALRHHAVPLGLLTNGNDWTLVAVGEGGTTSFVTWTRHAWLDEPDTLKAFVALLGRQRFFGVDDSQTLPALLAESLRRQEELTDRLSDQAHAAVEMLVAVLGRADVNHRERHGSALLPEGVMPADVYSASVTVFMRLLFLLYAEERDLLPLDDDTYATAYAVTTLVRQLRAAADERGEPTLERSTAAWHRLLATFRAVHRGTRHHGLNLNAYGGSLFDPDRFPWLEGRHPDQDGTVPPLDDRTILRALEALTKVRVPGEPEPRAVSFAALDVEQIGYVYEGLLDQDAQRAETWICGMVGDTRGLKDGPELPLHELEAQLARGDDAFSAWLSKEIKDAGGSMTASAIAKRMVPLDADDRLEGERLVRPVASGQQQIVERLLPFTALLRRDPRDLPVVYAPGSLYLTESSLRANTGAVYTPRSLAERVVNTTLEAVVYSPGPLDTEDRQAWRLITPDALLELSVIDIAAGSGAFLVSAARYLATRLQEAWVLHTPHEPALRLHPDEQRLAATRAVIDHCIYGVDINPLALEMAKLSLWLISLDKGRPFGFLDDKLAVGDTLLGISHPDQIRTLHFDPKKGRKLHEDVLAVWPYDTDALLKSAAELRRQIAEIDLHDSRDADHKSRLLERAAEITERLTVVGDALSGASLRGGTDIEYLSVANKVAAANSARVDDEEPWQHLEDYAAEGLLDPDGGRRRPAHFPLLFPEAFADGRGFSVVVGNPPFLGGQKLTGAFGVPYRQHLQTAVGHGVKGSADLVAYMVLRAEAVLDRDQGHCGLIATNTLAQGDTREVGLDQVTAGGLDLRGAVKSEKWPTQGANLEFSIVWGSRKARGDGIYALADGLPVPAITPSLDPAGRITGNPHRLDKNVGVSFQGCIVLGKGFILSPERANQMIDADPRNAEVLFPYVNGEDLNSRPDSSGSRWVIDFNDWAAERCAGYRLPWEHINMAVKPERQRRNDQGAYVLRSPLPERYWQYAEKRPALRKATASLDHVLAIARVSKVVLPVLVPTGQVLSEACVVFASEDLALLGMLSSSPHYWWAIRNASSMRTDLRYTPSDVFETLPLPPLSSDMRAAGQRLHETRSAFMLDRQMGLTKTYNLVHDPLVTDPKVQELRDIHVAIDEAVIAAYDWMEVPLGHGHHETRQGVRFTISPAAQVEVLDRLLELNHQRAAAEAAARLGGVKGGPKKRKPSAEAAQDSLFGDVEEQR